MSRLVELLTTMNEKKSDKEMQDEYLAKGGKINTGKSSDGVGSSNKVSAKTAAGLDDDLEELNTRSKKAKDEKDEEEGWLHQATKQGQRLTVKLTSTDFDIPSDFVIKTQIAVGDVNNSTASDGIQGLAQKDDKFSIGNDTTINISVGTIADIFKEIEDAAVMPENTKFALQISGSDVKYGTGKEKNKDLRGVINSEKLVSYSSASATKGKIETNNVFKLALNLVIVAV